MSRHDSKQTRSPIGTQTSVNKMDDVEHSRNAIGSLKRIDTSRYERMDIYKDKQLFGALTNGEVDQWLELGARPVPRVGATDKVFKGINDRVESEYQVYYAVSVVEGVKIDMVLMYIDKDLYEKYKLAPLRAKNAAIREAMGFGMADDGARVMPNVKGLKTYAPMVSESARGISTTRGGELTHDV